MKLLNDICIKGARVWRTLNRPVLRSNMNIRCELFGNESSESPSATLKIADAPEVKLFDLILAIAAIKVLLSVIGSLKRLFKH